MKNSLEPKFPTKKFLLPKIPPKISRVKDSHEKIPGSKKFQKQNPQKSERTKNSLIEKKILGPKILEPNNFIRSRRFKNSHEKIAGVKNSNNKFL